MFKEIFNLFRFNSNKLPILNKEIELLEYKKMYEEKKMKEKILALLIDVSNMMLTDNLDRSIIENIIQTMINITNSKEIYYSKFSNNKFIRQISYKKHNFDYTSYIYEDLDLPEFYEILLNHQCFIANNNEFDKQEKIIFNKSNVYSLCCCPIIIDSKLEGILGFQTDDSITWSQDTVNLCQILASLVSTYIKKEILINSLKQSKVDTEKACQAVELTVSLIDGYMWHKDAQGKYLYCTPEWKRLFFDLDPHIDVSGNNDIELLNDYRIRTNNEHTYGNICVGTDEHCKQQGHTCYYIEIGYINNKIFILEVTKTPHYDINGNYIGIVGIAKDRSQEENLITFNISEYIKKGICVNLNPDNMFNEHVTAYWIKNKEASKLISQISGILPR